MAKRLWETWGISHADTSPRGERTCCRRGRNAAQLGRVQKMNLTHLQMTSSLCSPWWFKQRHQKRPEVGSGKLNKYALMCLVIFNFFYTFKLSFLSYQLVAAPRCRCGMCNFCNILFAILFEKTLRVFRIALVNWSCTRPASASSSSKQLLCQK